MFPAGWHLWRWLGFRGNAADGRQSDWLLPWRCWLQISSDCERNWVLLRRRDCSFWIYGLPKGAYGSQNRLQPGSLGWITGKMVLFKRRRKPGSQAATALQRVGSKTIPPSIHLLILPPPHWVWGGRSTQRIPSTYCVFLDCGKSGKPQ